jgi:two-component system, NtrC family, response regulator HydG
VKTKNGNDQKRNILIVDDDRDMCSSLADVMSLVDDYNVTTCTNPKKAIELVRKTDLSLVLMDYKMPDMNGIETVKEIKKIKPDLPIIILTAFLSAELVEEARREGVLTVLSKFIWPDELLRQVGKVFGKTI